MEEGEWSLWKARRESDTMGELVMKGDDKSREKWGQSRSSDCKSEAGKSSGA